MHTTLTEETQALDAVWAKRMKEIALSRLTHDWQPLAEIRVRNSAGNFGFADLVNEGAAVARYMRDEKPGRRIQYKLAGEAPATSSRAQRRKERKQAA